MVRHEFKPSHDHLLLAWARNFMSFSTGWALETSCEWIKQATVFCPINLYTPRGTKTGHNISSIFFIFFLFRVTLRTVKCFNTKQNCLKGCWVSSGGVVLTFHHCALSLITSFELWDDHSGQVSVFSSWVSRTYLAASTNTYHISPLKTEHTARRQHKQCTRKKIWEEWTTWNVSQIWLEQKLSNCKCT